MTTAIDRIAADLGTSPYEVAAATLLAASGCTVRQWVKRNRGRAHIDDDDWGIEVPRPRGPISFGVFAHEIGHQMLHRHGSKPRWREEVEAEEYALQAFDTFGLKGRERYERTAARHIWWAFRKAIRRGAAAGQIQTAAPRWWALAEQVDAEALVAPSKSRERRELDSPNAGASGEEE